MNRVFAEYDQYIRRKYNVEPGYITMNMPRLLDGLEPVNIYNPIICSSINKIGFRISGGKDYYEKTLSEKKFRPIAMQVLASCAIIPEVAISYLDQLTDIKSVLFGASSKEHIVQTKDLIEMYIA